MSGFDNRVGPPVAAAAAAAVRAAAATSVARRMPDESDPRETSPAADAAHRPGPPSTRYSNGAPDPSGRSGGLVDVFA